MIVSNMSSHHITSENDSGQQRFVHLKITCSAFNFDKLLMKNNYSFPVWRPNNNKKSTAYYLLLYVLFLWKVRRLQLLFLLLLFFFVNNYRVALNNNNHISCMKWQSKCSNGVEKEQKMKKERPSKQKRTKHCFKQILEKMRLAQEEKESK